MDKCGIIILNYNTYDETVECIDSIRKHSSVLFHIYVVDNLSKDGSGGRLFEKYSDSLDTTVILNEVNAGYSAGNNVGIKRAEEDGCDYIFIVNSDVELLNDAFSKMLELLKSNSELMMVGPSVLDVNGDESQLPRKKLAFSTFLFERHPFCYFAFFRKLAYRKVDIVSQNPTFFEGSVSGCCFCISSVDFKKIDYLDENEFLYYEEDTLAYKMSKLNKYAAVDTEAKVLHKANISTDKEGNAFVQFHRWTSVLYMLKTYAKIGKGKQIFIALWNIFAWNLLSLKSKKYLDMKEKFVQKNWQIVRGVEKYE